MRRFVIVIVQLAILVLLFAAGASASDPEATENVVTALFVRYYSALQYERWDEAFELLHERLKRGLRVETPRDLDRRNAASQQELFAFFQRFYGIEVAKTEVDLRSIHATVTPSRDGNVTAQVVYNLLVFPTRSGRTLMFRVELDVGLAQGLITRLIHHSLTRIDPDAARDAVSDGLLPA